MSGFVPRRFGLASVIIGTVPESVNVLIGRYSSRSLLMHVVTIFNFLEPQIPMREAYRDKSFAQKDGRSQCFL